MDSKETWLLSLLRNPAEWPRPVGFNSCEGNIGWNHYYAWASNRSEFWVQVFGALSSEKRQILEVSLNYFSGNKV